MNGNHLDADAAGIVFAGLFFGAGARPTRWAKTGWSLLLAELPRQVTPDGVDFEMSTAYHRLVTELFLLPALLATPARPARAAAGTSTGSRRWRASPRRTRGRTGPRPRWGDADDARALPLGGQALGDHRYLGGARWPRRGAPTCRSRGPRARGRMAARRRRGRGARGHAAARARSSSPTAAARCCAAATTTSSSTAARSASPAEAGHGHNDITVARRRARRRPAAARPRHVHLHALAGVAEPLPRHRRAQRRAGRRRGAEPARRAATTSGASATTRGPLDADLDGGRRAAHAPRRAHRLSTPVRARSRSHAPCSSTPSCTGCSCVDDVDAQRRARALRALHAAAGRRARAASDAATDHRRRPRASTSAGRAGRPRRAPAGSRLPTA